MFCAKESGANDPGQEKNHDAAADGAATHVHDRTDPQNDGVNGNLKLHVFWSAPLAVDTWPTLALAQEGQED